MNMAGIVLCGGRSQRMGRSKAWLPCGREYLLQRVVRIVTDSVGHVVVAARRHQDLPPLPSDVDLVYDAIENSGPLAGVAAGFDSLQGRCEAAFVTSCDHPLLSPAFIARLIELLGNHPAVLPFYQQRWYPLTAVYRLNTGRILSRLLAQGERRVQQFARCCEPRIATEADLRVADPDLDSLRNVNDPSDHQRVIESLDH